MQKRASFFPIFLLFLLLSIIIFSFSANGFFRGFSGFFEMMTVPLQRITFDVFHIGKVTSSEDTLREENARLVNELAKKKEIERENKALHDQFLLTNPSPRKLLPTKIVGSHDDEIIIDKGEDQGVKQGQIVVYKDNVVGQVLKVSMNRAVVRLLISEKLSFTARDVQTNASGVIFGRGGDDVIFGNVVQSEKLEKGDIVTTRGDIDSQGRGFPPDLVVGKIISINKRASSLFQQAEVRSLVNFGKLEMVFVMIDS